MLVEVSAIHVFPRVLFWPTSSFPSQTFDWDGVVAGKMHPYYHRMKHLAPQDTNFFGSVVLLGAPTAGDALRCACQLKNVLDY